MPDKIFATLSDYCRITGRSYSSALRDVRQGRVMSVRIGKTILIPIESLLRLASGTEKVAQPIARGK